MRLIVAALAWVVLAASASAQSAPVRAEGLPAALEAAARPLLEAPAPDTAFAARRDAEGAAAALLRLLESEGYYAATADPWWEAAPPYLRGVRVRHGPLFTIAGAAVEWLGPPPAEDADAAARLPLLEVAAGVPARAPLILAAEDAMLQALRRAGYPDAQASPVDALADGRAHTIEATFRISPGVRAALGRVRLSGAASTRAGFIEELRPYQIGDPYSPAALETFRKRLIETGLFEAASVTLDRTDPSAALREVEVQLVEAPRRTVAFGASASTSEGLGGEAEWRRRNLTGRGDALTLTARVATLESRAGVAYARPSVGDYGCNVEVGAAWEGFTTDAFDQQGVTLTASLEEELTERLKAGLGVRASQARITDARSREGDGGERDLTVLSATASAEYLGVGDVLDPVEGLRLRASVEPGLTAGDSRIAYTRVVAEAGGYHPWAEGRFVAAARARIGLVAGPDGAPPDRLFFAGGGGSVRGYEFQSLSPRSPEGGLQGGRSLVETSVEVRWRREGRFGWVFFLDGGAAGEGVDPPFGDMRFGAGVGLRYNTGFGPLRLDLGAPLDPRDGDAPVQVYLSIGQAF